MKANNASTNDTKANVRLLPFQKRIKQLLQKEEDFEQMKTDIQERVRFEKMIIDEPFD